MPRMPTFVALVAHFLAYWLPASRLADPGEGLWGWVLCYVGGAVALLLSHRYKELQLSTRIAAELTGYATLAALLFWGANQALDLLGNSVSARRIPPEWRMAFPLHFVLFPGLAAYGFGAWFAAAGRHRAARRA